MLPASTTFIKNKFFRNMTDFVAKAWHHSSLAVSDLTTGVNFYCAAFGYKIEFEERDMRTEIEQIAGIPGLSCDLAQLRAPYSDHVLELIAFHKPPAESVNTIRAPIYPGLAHIAFLVDDLNLAMKKVESLGARRLGTVTHFSEGDSVYYREPAGSFIEMEQLHLES